MYTAVRLLYAYATIALTAAGSTAAATDHYENALTRFKAHDYEGAVLELKTELQSSPDNLSALLLLGRAYLRTGHAAGAEQVLEQARTAGADDSLTAVPLARAFAMQRKFEALEGISTGGLSDSLRAELVSLQGEAQVALQRYEEAKASFEKAISIDPLSPAPWRGKARLEMARGRVHAAAAHTEKAILLGTENHQTWFLDAEAKRIGGDLEGALTSYDRAVSLTPRYVDARVARAAVLIDLGREGEAKADIEHILARNAQQPQALYLKAMLLVRAGRTEEAGNALQEATAFLDKASPEQLRESAPMLLLAGVAASAQGRLEIARARLEQFIEMEPEHAAARQILASVLVRLGEPERTLFILRPVLASATAQPEAFATAGLAHRQLGNHPESMQAFERAIQGSTDSTRWRIELARTRFAAGQPQRAVTELESVLELDHPLAIAAGTVLARMRLELGEPRKAVATADAVLARDPDNLPALLLRGDAQLTSGDAEAAMGSYEQALAIAPDNLAPRYGLANAHLATGRTREAAAQFEAILERDPDQTLAMIGVSRVAVMEQRTDDALRWLEKARATDRSMAMAHAELVALHLRQGNAAEALTAAREFTGSLPDSAAAHIALGRSQVAVGDEDAAKATYGNAAFLRSASAEQITAIARGQLALGDAGGARASLAAALKKDPEHLPAHATLITVDLNESKIQAAMDRTSALRRRQPRHAGVVALAGDVMLAAGDAEGAIKAYLEAAGLRADPSIQVKLYRARWQAGRQEQAIEGLEAWVASHPEGVEARRALAGAYLASGRLGEAQSLHEQLLIRVPRDFELMNNLAWLYQTRGDQRALATAESAYSIAPRQPATLDTYGWILMEAGQLEQALKILRQAQALAPRQPWVQFHTAVALSRLGRDTEARELLETLLASNTSFPKQEEARALLERLAGK